MILADIPFLLITNSIMTIPSSYKEIVLNNAPSKEVNLKDGENSCLELNEQLLIRTQLKMERWLLKRCTFLTICAQRDGCKRENPFKKNVFTNFRK